EDLLQQRGVINYVELYEPPRNSHHGPRLHPRPLAAACRLGGPRGLVRGRARVGGVTILPVTKAPGRGENSAHASRPSRGGVITLPGATAIASAQVKKENSP